MLHVRSAAKIDQWATAVYSGTFTIGNPLVDEVKLILAVLKNVDKVGLGKNKTLEGLLFLYDVGTKLLKGGLISLLDSTSRHNGQHLI